MTAAHSQSSPGFICRIRMTVSGTIFRDKIFPFGCLFRKHSRALISSGSATINWRTQPLSSSQNCHPPELSIKSCQLVRSYSERQMTCERNLESFTGQCLYIHALGPAPFDHNLHHCSFW